MTTPDVDEERLRRALNRFVKITPPAVGREAFASRTGRARRRAGTLAVAVGTLLLASGVLTAALVLHAKPAGTPVGLAASSSSTATPSRPAVQSPVALGPACTDASGLTVAEYGAMSDMTGYYQVWTVTGAASACSLKGFPSAAAVDGAGASVSTVHVSSEAGVTPAGVAVGPASAGASTAVGSSTTTASFYIEFPVCSVSPTEAAAPSPEPYSLALSLPGMSTRISVLGLTTDTWCSSQPVIVSAVSQGLVLPPGFTTGGSPGTLLGPTSSKTGLESASP